MFDQISLRKDRLWLYSTGRFAEERRAFLCDLNDRGYLCGQSDSSIYACFVSRSA